MKTHRIWTRYRHVMLALAVFAMLALTGAVRYDWIVAKKITVLEGGLDVAGAALLSEVTTDSDVTLTTGDLILSAGSLTFTPSTTQTVTMNGSITVDGPTTLLSSAGAVGTSTVACGSHGDLVLYVNVGSQNIVITDTGTLKLSGNTTLGQFDNLALQNVWGNCIEIAQVDN